MPERNPATATDLMVLSAASRGDKSLAAARGLGPGALAALWALLTLADRSGRPDLALVLGDGLIALDAEDPRCHAFRRRRVRLASRAAST